MYDSVTPTNIPVWARMVAGYVNGRYKWSDAAWARFPNAVKVGISVRSYWYEGHVLDVEPGDATPAEAPEWANIRRVAGVDPTIYCNRSTLPLVQEAFRSAGIKQPNYWIATASKQPVLYPGAVAAQYWLDVQPQGFPGTVDISIVDDYWPSVDPAPSGGGEGTGGDEPSPKFEEDDMVMQPKYYGPVKDGGVAFDTLIHDGLVDSVLNVVLLSSNDKPLFFGNPAPDAPVFCYGPRGGLGGGDSTVSEEIDPDHNRRKILRNSPGQYFIPKGTTSVAFSYSTNGNFALQIVPKV